MKAGKGAAPGLVAWGRKTKNEVPAPMDIKKATPVMGQLVVINSRIHLWNYIIS